MTNGFEVVPESLEGMATAMADAKDSFSELKETVESWTMESFAFGVLGELANYPDTYNKSIQDVADALDKFVTSFDDADHALGKSAKHYADKDASWYEQFGYLEEDLD